MSFWKVLGGAVIGVGAIAAAPFTGGGSVLGAATLLSSLAGAGTIAAAVGAGVAGAAVGAAMSGNDDDARDAAYQAGRMDAKAEQELAMRNLEEKLTIALQKLQESSSYFGAVLALEAVAVAVANCDGEICEQERADIEAFISGISSSSLPEEVKARIQGIYDNPVSLREAFSLAVSSGLDMSVFDEVILLVMHSDGVVHEQEEAFMQAWNQLKVA